MHLPCVQPLLFELWYFLPPGKFHPLPVKLAGIHAKASRQLCRHEFQISACHTILVMSDTVCIAPPKSLGNRKVWTKQKLKDMSKYDCTKYLQKIGEYSLETCGNFGSLKKQWSQRLMDHFYLHLSNNHGIPWKCQNHRELHKLNCRRKCPRTFMLRTRLELAQLHQRKKCMYMQSCKVHQSLPRAEEL